MDTFVLIGTIVIVVLSITTHEAAHAWVADRLGDSSARQAGRVTLNPIPHIDLFMTILLPGMLLMSGSPFVFGGAKPVMVNIFNLRRPRRDWALVALAGPLSNILQAFMYAGLIALLISLGVFTSESLGTQVLAVGIYANALLAVFNLIPIPPLDGSRVLMYFLRGEALAKYIQLERFGILIVLALVWMSDWFHSLLWNGMLIVIEAAADTFGVYNEVVTAMNKLFN
jgi:Zn-dependent protease